MFRQASAGESAIDQEDAAFWNVEADGIGEVAEVVEIPDKSLVTDPLVAFAVQELGAVMGTTIPARRPAVVTVIPIQRRETTHSRRRKFDLLAVPEDESEETLVLLPAHRHVEEVHVPQQLAMF